MLPPFFFSVRLPTLLSIGWSRLRGVDADAGRKEPVSFILFRLDSLGDVVLTTPLLRAIKNANPGSRCTVVVQAEYRSLLVTNPYVDEVLSPPRLKQRWLPVGVKRLLAALVLYWTELRRRRFAYAISPRWDVDEHLATLLCVSTKAGKRIGYSCRTTVLKSEVNRGFDSAYDISLPGGPLQHEVERNLAVAQALGVHVENRKLDIRITGKDRQDAGKHLERIPLTARLVAVGIGAASIGRQWPVARYAETLNQLVTAGDVWPVIVCSHEEGSAALKLHRLLGQQATVISGAPLREVCAVLERCDLFIGNDSGCAHLAAAMDCPTLVVSRHPLGGDPDHFNSPARFRPWGAHVSVIQPAIAAGNCVTACKVPAPHCILGVTVDEVVSAARRFLDRSTSPLPRANDWERAPTSQLLLESTVKRVPEAVHDSMDGSSF